MYLLLTGRLPFSGETPRDLLSEALSCQLQLESSLWADISKDAKNLIKKIINTDVKERYSIQKVLEHPWFDQVRDDSTEDSHSEAELRVLETLAGFTTENKFTKACMRVIASITKMPQDPAISQEFSKIDEKQNAIISKEELRNAFDKKALSLSDKEINAIIGDLNYSGEQHINYTEFCTASMDKYEVLSPKNCKTLFNYFDTDKDGVVTQKDIFLGLEKSGIFTKAQIKAIVKDSGISKAKAFELEEFEELVSF
uniref:Calcium-dependent protein kinase n=1 Tax=Euplotes crassus TaxID=5936 RepID=A0A7S3NXU4_EUPCR|mmetsp:Transcript_5443/g.5177  ORF Transcript_5443/g.5177 Transcript_5443/m.5177 type:complete len:255 (+) Transcript_5443:160-924(+)